MSATEFINLQEALIIALGPVIQWLLVLLLASAVISAVFVVWMSLLRWLSTRR